MDIQKLYENIKEFKDTETDQGSMSSHAFIYSNEYLETKVIETSNVAGGKSVINGKMWSIIFEHKKDFTTLSNWKKLQERFDNNIRITPVTKGKNKGSLGIRVYKMSKSPTDKIIKEMLDFIFS